MKTGIFLSIFASFAAAQVYSSDFAAVFKNSHCLHEEFRIMKANVDEGIYSLADDADMGFQYTITDNVELDKISYGKCVGQQPSSKKEIIVVVNGVESPVNVFQARQKPLYVIDFDSSRANINKFQTFIKELSSNGEKLSSEVTLMTETNISKLKSIWSKYFNLNKSNVERMWEDLKSAFGDESVLKISKRSLNTPSINEFLNEMTQLDYFFKQDVQGKVIVTLDSPMKLYKNSKDTYETAMESLTELLNKNMNSDDVDLTVIVLPISEQTVKQSPMSKRDLEFSRSLSASAGCFKSQAACIDSTNSCSSHGLCSNLNGCWQCVCSSTFAKEQTTYWTGGSCEKVDYSSQFNLLFWTSLIIIFTMVGGIKLMYKAGEEPMPGVLLAATVQTKKSS